jgi:beta-1,4-mannooligosaccharide/beta-1,4-mannosyl-N-acetylglucosamine phosphorylase
MKNELIPGTILRKIRDDFRTQNFVTRYKENPVLSPSQVPYASTNTHNCGVIRYKDGFIMLFRNDARKSKEDPNNCISNIGVADSPDGVNWIVRDKPTPIFDNDPRIIFLEGRYYICTAHNSGAATYVTDDFETFETVDITMPVTRNQVIFPEKIKGKYYRLERPMWQPLMPYVNAGKPPEGWIGDTWDIWLTESKDLEYWGKPSRLLKTDQLEYANAKIGGGAPPIKTKEGWLCLIHGDDIDPRRGKNGWEPTWFGRYHCGVMLLDLENPKKVLAYSKIPMMTPEMDYELKDGYRNNVIFVTSAYVNDDEELVIYYGAADTYVCMARAKLQDVLDFCLKDD